MKKSLVPVFLLIISVVFVSGSFIPKSEASKPAAVVAASEIKESGAIPEPAANPSPIIQPELVNNPAPAITKPVPVKKPATVKTAPLPKPQPIVAPTPPPAPEPVESCDTGSFNAQFVCLLNEYRKSKGLNRLVYEAGLNTTALAHSTWMEANSTMSHVGENGSKFTERCQQNSTVCDAENVAMGYITAQKLFEAWKNSPGHNANMLGSHTKMGLSLVGRYATQLFK